MVPFCGLRANLVIIDDAMARLVIRTCDIATGVADEDIVWVVLRVVRSEPAEPRGPLLESVACPVAARPYSPRSIGPADPLPRPASDRLPRLAPRRRLPNRRGAQLRTVA